MKEQDKKILSALEALCSRREYCSSDIRSKALKMTGGDSVPVQEIMESLVRDGFVDDRRYARAFSNDKASLTGWGPVKISYALKRKGLDPDIVAEAVSSLDSQKGAEKMERVLKEKLRTLKRNDPFTRGKLVRFALSRGYLYDDIMDFVDGLTEDE